MYKHLHVYMCVIYAMHGEAKGQHVGVFFIHCLLYLLIQGLSLFQLGILLSPFPQHCGCVLQTQLFTYMLDI